MGNRIKTQFMFINTLGQLLINKLIAKAELDVDFPLKYDSWKIRLYSKFIEQMLYKIA